MIRCAEVTASVRLVFSHCALFPYFLFPLFRIPLSGPLGVHASLDQLSGVRSILIPFVSERQPWP